MLADALAQRTATRESAGGNLDQAKTRLKRQGLPQDEASQDLACHLAHREHVVGPGFLNALDLIDQRDASENRNLGGVLAKELRGQNGLVVALTSTANREDDGAGDARLRPVQHLGIETDHRPHPPRRPPPLQEH